MALASWNVLCAGMVRTDAEKEQQLVTGEHGRKLIDPNWERNEAERKMCKELEQVAKEVGSNTIQAGEPDFGGSCHCVFGVLTSGLFSRHRLSFAENHIRVPTHRGSEGGAPYVEL
jgi:hypothetical protein